MKYTNRELSVWLFKIFLCWRVLLIFFEWVGTRILPFKFSFPYVKEMLYPYGNQLLWSWANFDGVHYLGIAVKGYFAQYTQAFFPLFPLIIRLGASVWGNPLITGLLLNHIFFFLSLFVLFKLLQLDYSVAISKRIIIFIVLFPTSFFFASLYTESLFFLLSVSTFYFCRKRRWWLVSVLALIASATRVIGILLVPAIIWEIFNFFKENRVKISGMDKIRIYLAGILPFLGIGLYMLYLNNSFSDPLYFFHAQPAFGASRDSSRIILIYQVFFRYLKMFFTVDFDTFLFYSISLEFFSTLGFLVLLFLAFKEKIRTSYIIFSAFAFILPTLTGTFSSMPRYVLILFPGFIVLGLAKSRLVRLTVYLIFIFLLGFSTILFTRGYWIA